MPKAKQTKEGLTMNKRWNDKIQLELTRKELYTITKIVRAEVSPGVNWRQIAHIQRPWKIQAKDTLSKCWNKAAKELEQAKEG